MNCELSAGQRLLVCISMAAGFSAAPRLAQADASFHIVADTSLAVEGRTFDDLSAPNLSLRQGARALFGGRAMEQGKTASGLWLLKDGHVSLVVADDDSLGSSELVVHLEYGNVWQLDSQDAVAGWLRTGPEYRDMIAHGQPGALAPLLEYGQAHPELPNTPLRAIDMVPSAVANKAVVVASYYGPFEPGQTTQEVGDVRSWLLVDGKLQPFLNNGDAAPAPNGTFTSGPYAYAIHADGSVLFGAPTTTGAGNLFVAREEGTVQLVARLDELPAPFAEPNILLARLSTMGDLTLASEGFALNSDVFEKSVWFGEPDALELLARSRAAPSGEEVSPGGPRVLWNLGVFSSSPSGEWLALTGRADIYSSVGLWAGHPDDLREILRESEPVMGMPDVTCNFIDDVQVNEHGQLAIFAKTNLGSSVFRYDPQSGLELMASDSTPITVDGATEPRVFAYAAGDTIADDGSIYLMARWSAGGADSRRTLLRSDPLSSHEPGEPGGNDDGGATPSAGVDAGDTGGGSGSGGSVSSPSSGTSSSSGEDGGLGADPGDAMPEAEGRKRREGGCSLGELRSLSCFELGLFAAVAGLLLARKRAGSSRTRPHSCTSSPAPS